MLRDNNKVIDTLRHLIPLTRSQEDELLNEITKIQLYIRNHMTKSDTEYIEYVKEIIKLNMDEKDKNNHNIWKHVLTHYNTTGESGDQLFITDQQEKAQKERLKNLFIKCCYCNS